MNTSDQIWMTKALHLAYEARDNAEVPVGALVVLNDQIIGQAHNLVRTHHDPTAHAEILALRRACTFLKNERLPGATLYVTLEPCVMCLGALLQTRISRLVFATRDLRAGAAGSIMNLSSGFGVYGGMQVDEGVCQKECESVLKTFFSQHRA